MDPQVVPYSERPELWDSISDLSDEVWPEYNQHGETLNYYWAQLYDVFPEWQFVLYDPADKTVLAEGHTIPLAWDGTIPATGRPAVRLVPAHRFPAHRWPPPSADVSSGARCTRRRRPASAG